MIVIGVLLGAGFFDACGGFNNTQMDDSIRVDVAALGKRTLLEVSRHKQSFWALMFPSFSGIAYSSWPNQTAS